MSVLELTKNLEKIANKIVKIIEITNVINNHFLRSVFNLSNWWLAIRRDEISIALVCKLTPVNAIKPKKAKSPDRTP